MQHPIQILSSSAFMGHDPTTSNQEQGSSKHIIQQIILVSLLITSTLRPLIGRPQRLHQQR
ncbi:hypothetical protein LX59_03033 [Azomonas agilis]|uniref:Uncharacterized protein n=1 Tax=Azomonas agilis TaxID=116849 RepID=A0A562HYL4_9GAMM|nr:hypothetical protein LX59_03033 [Azomonas agilis]